MTVPTADFLRDLNDDALAEMVEVWDQESKDLRKGSQLARDELTERMKERNATHIDTEHWAGKVRPGPFEHVVDDEAMDRTLAPLVSAEVYDTCRNVVPETKAWDHRKLNELWKLGGDVAKVIDAARVSTRQRGKLELTRKEVTDAPVQDDSPDLPPAKADGGDPQRGGKGATASVEGDGAGA